MVKGIHKFKSRFNLAVVIIGSGLGVLQIRISHFLGILRGLFRSLKRRVETGEELLLFFLQDFNFGLLDRGVPVPGQVRGLELWLKTLHPVYLLLL